MLTSILLSVAVAIAIALIVWYIVERFSPDVLITKILQVVIFLAVLYFVVLKLLPLIH